MGTNLAFLDMGTGRTIKRVVPGQYSTCAILDNDTLKCWGANSAGELGQGDTTHRGDNSGELGNNLPTVDLGTGRTVKQFDISVASAYSLCVLLDNDTVKCWGDNLSGFLGYGDTINRGDDPGEMGNSLPTIDLGTNRTAKQISVGGGFTCAVLDNDELKCWGLNDNAQLGYGDVSFRGDASGEMGDNLPYIDLGTGRTAKQVSAADAHVCVILDNDSVKCWGRSDKGELGYGDVEMRGDGSGEMGDNLPAVDLGTGRTAKQIQLGRYHTCAILDNDQVKCWGRNDYGTSGLGDTNHRGDGSGEMGDSLPYVDLGTSRTALQLTAGYDHTCAVLDNLEVKCWGRNEDGSLGLGDTGTANYRGDGSGEMGNNLPSVDLLGN